MVLPSELYSYLFVIREKDIPDKWSYHGLPASHITMNVN